MTASPADDGTWVWRKYLRESRRAAWTVGLRPWEFYAVTPAELGEMAAVLGEREMAQEKERWRRAAFIAAAVMNSAGKTYRKTIKPEELLTFGDEKNRMTAEERDRRRAEAAETLRLHKQKFWTKFKDASVAKLTGE